MEGSAMLALFLLSMPKAIYGYGSPLFPKSNNMEELTPQSIGLFALIGLILFLALQRWFLGIDAQLKNQKIIIELLTKLCQQQGVEEKDLGELKNIIGKK